MRSSPVVSIVIVNYNGKVYLENCLSSIAKSTFKSYEIILVDNASKDGSVDFVKKYSPWVKVIQNEENLGFAEGNNIGAKHANGDYILFLNNDTEVTSRWLEQMVEVAGTDSSIGICGSKVLLLDRKNIIDVIGGFLCDIYGSGLYALGHLTVDHHQYDSIRDIFSVVGACLLIRRKVFEEIGGFDSRYFILGEDIDLSWRAQLAGYRVIVNPLAVIYHKSMGTIGPRNYRERCKLRFLSERNTVRTLLKNYSYLTLFEVLPRYFAILLFEIALFLILGRARLALADIKAVIWNITNLRETWYLHGKIQQIRVTKDDDIQKRMIPQSLKICNFRSLFKHLMLED